MRKIEIIVKTRAKKTEIIEELGDKLTMAVKAAPEDGKANIELLKFLSRHYKCRPEIVSGFSSKRKIIRLS